MKFSYQVRANVQQWLSQENRHTGRHRYRLADFSLKEQDVDQRFSAYNECFAGFLKLPEKL